MMVWLNYSRNLATLVCAYAYVDAYVAHASVDIFVLFYLVLIVMSINLNLKGLMFLRTLVLCT